MNFKKKLNPPKMNAEQKKVYTLLKNTRYHEKMQHWNSFACINKLINEIIDEFTTQEEPQRDSIEQVNNIKSIKSKLKFSELKRFKNTVYSNSREQSPNGKLTCFYCEQVMDDRGRAQNNCNTIEHIIDKGINPSFTFAPFNLIPICNACNVSKGDFSVILNNDEDKSLNRRSYIIIHPYIDNKDEYLRRNKISWEIVDCEDELKKTKAKNTIDIYNMLNVSISMRDISRDKIEERKRKLQLLVDTNLLDNDVTNLVELMTEFRIM